MNCRLMTGAFTSADQCSIPQAPETEPECFSPELSTSRLEYPGVLSDQHFPPLSYKTRQPSSSNIIGSPRNSPALTNHDSPPQNPTALPATRQRTLVPTYDHDQSSFVPQSAFLNTSLQGAVSLNRSTETAGTSLPLPGRFASQIPSTTNYRSPTYAALYHQTMPLHLPGEMSRPIPRRRHESAAVEGYRSRSPSTQILLKSGHGQRQLSRETGNVGYTTFSVHPLSRSSSSGSSSVCGRDKSARGCFPQNWVENVTGATEFVYSTIVSFGTHAAESTFPPIVNYLGGLHSGLSIGHGISQVSNHDGADDSDSEVLLPANQSSPLKSDDGLSFKTQECFKTQKSLSLGDFERYADAETGEGNTARRKKSKGKERLSAFLEDLPEVHRHRYVARQTFGSSNSQVGNTSNGTTDQNYKDGTEGLRASLANMFSEAELLEQKAEKGKKREIAAGVSLLTQGLSKLKGTEHRETLNTGAGTTVESLQELYAAIIELGSIMRDWGQQEHVSIADTKARQHDPALYRQLLELYEALRQEELDADDEEDAPEYTQQLQNHDAGVTETRRQLDGHREDVNTPLAYYGSNARNAASREPLDAELVPRSASRHMIGIETGMSTTTTSDSGSRNFEGGERRLGQHVEGCRRAALESLAEENDHDEPELAESYWEEDSDAETSR